MIQKKKVAFYTLGCKLNFSETSSIARLMGNHDYERVDFDEAADVYVINTCSVTETADRKCRNIIRKAITQSPHAFVAVVGCYSQLKPQEVATIPGVDIVLGTNDKFDILQYLNKLEKRTVPEVHSCETNDFESFHPSFSAGDRTRAFLKVQDGCDYQCTYCTIPIARGKSRNNTIEKTLIEAHEAAKAGVHEIVLTGINLGDFGRSTGENFLQLIEKLDAEIPVDRFRISSIEPNLISNEVIQFCSQSKKFVPHFHIPLQSGSDKILKLMKRRYLRDVFANRILYIKELMPNACIGADVIVGFPTETDADFEETYHFLQDLPMSYLHVFSFSVRANTPAAELTPFVKEIDKTNRSKKLHQLSDKKRLEFYQSQADTTQLVLFESGEEKGMMFGRTENYVKVAYPYDKELINKTLELKLGIPVFDYDELCMNVI